MTFLLISKYHQQTSIPCNNKKDCFFFLPLFSHFCVHHMPPQLSPERLQHAQREQQSREQQLRGLQQRPWWGGGGHDIWGARPRWRGRWDDGPERPSHGTVCMQRPRGRVRGGRRQGGSWGGALGVTLHCFVVRCLLVESSCWMCHRTQEWKPSDEQQVHDVIGSTGCWHAHLDAAFCFLWNSSLKVIQAFCHGWKIWDCRVPISGKKIPSILETAIFLILCYFQL